MESEIITFVMNTGIFSQNINNTSYVSSSSYRGSKLPLFRATDKHLKAMNINPIKCQSTCRLIVKQLEQLNM